MALPRMHKFLMPAGAWLLARIFLQELFPPRMHEFLMPAGAWLLARIFLLGVFSATDAQISYA
jgi:hypothetical protein